MPQKLTENIIYIKDGSFLPNYITIKVNTSIRYENCDPISYTIECRGSLFAPEWKFDKITSQTFTFTHAGKYEMTCREVVDMKCVIEVIEYDHENTPKKNNLYFPTAKDKLLLEQKKGNSIAAAVATAGAVRTATSTINNSHRSNSNQDYDSFESDDERYSGNSYDDNYSNSNSYSNSYDNNAILELTRQRKLWDYHARGRYRMIEESNDSEDEESNIITQREALKFSNSNNINKYFYGNRMNNKLINSEKGINSNYNKNNNIGTNINIHSHNSVKNKVPKPIKSVQSITFSPKESVIVTIEDYEFDCSTLIISIGQPIEFLLASTVPLHAEHIIYSDSFVKELVFESPLLQRSEQKKFVFTPKKCGEMTLSCRIYPEMSCIVTIVEEDVLDIGYSRKVCIDLENNSDCSMVNRDCTGNNYQSQPQIIDSSNSADGCIAIAAYEGVGQAVISIDTALSTKGDTLPSPYNTSLHTPGYNSECHSSRYDSDDVLSDYFSDRDGSIKAMHQRAHNVILSPNRVQSLVKKHEERTMKKIKYESKTYGKATTVNVVAKVESEPTATVIVDEFTFKPDTLSIYANDTVKFVKSFTGPSITLVCHQSFDSILLDDNHNSYIYRFLKSGDYLVKNEVYSFMGCKIKVIPESSIPKGNDRSNNNGDMSQTIPKLIGSFRVNQLPAASFRVPISKIVDSEQETSPKIMPLVGSFPIIGASHQLQSTYSSDSFESDSDNEKNEIGSNNTLVIRSSQHYSYLTTAADVEELVEEEYDNAIENVIVINNCDDENAKDASSAVNCVDSLELSPAIPVASSKKSKKKNMKKKMKRQKVAPTVVEQLDRINCADDCNNGVEENCCVNHNALLEATADYVDVVDSGEEDEYLSTNSSLKAVDSNINRATTIKQSYVVVETLCSDPIMSLAPQNGALSTAGGSEENLVRVKESEVCFETPKSKKKKKPRKNSFSVVESLSELQNYQILSFDGEYNATLPPCDKVDALVSVPVSELITAPVLEPALQKKDSVPICNGQYQTPVKTAISNSITPKSSFSLSGSNLLKSALKTFKSPTVDPFKKSPSSADVVDATPEKKLCPVTLNVSEDSNIVTTTELQTTEEINLEVDNLAEEIHPVSDEYLDEAELSFTIKMLSRMDNLEYLLANNLQDKLVTGREANVVDIDAYMVSSSHIVLSVIAEEKKFVTPKKTTYKSKAKTPKAHEKLVEIVDKSKKDVNSTNDGNKSHKTNSGKKYYYRSNKK